MREEKRGDGLQIEVVRGQAPPRLPAEAGEHRPAGVAVGLVALVGGVDAAIHRQAVLPGAAEQAAVVLVHPENKGEAGDDDQGEAGEKGERAEEPSPLPADRQAGDEEGKEDQGGKLEKCPGDGEKCGGDPGEAVRIGRGPA